MSAALDPRPIGWFAVARGDELRPGDERTGVLAATRYRLRRRPDRTLTADGGIGAVVEQNGLILAWHHPHREPPSWRVPALDEHGWRPLRHHLLRARSHPQEIYENSIDLGHFPVIHGYREIEVLQPMHLEGHQMNVRYQITRRFPIIDRGLIARFEVRLHGLGCAHNHIEVPGLGLRVRMFALATPTEPGQVEIRLAVSVARTSRIPLGALTMPLVHAGVTQGIVHDFVQDMQIWEHKRFLPRPMLVEGDGPIGGFRRWCRQFSANARAMEAA